jgi:hypothetical protein
MSLIGSGTLVKGLDDPRAYRLSKGWKQGLIRLFKVETEHTVLPMVQNEAVLSTNSGNGTPVTSLMILHTRPPSLALKRLQRANGRRESCQQQVLMICCMELDPTPFPFLLSSTTRSKPTDLLCLSASVRTGDRSYHPHVESNVQTRLRARTSIESGLFEKLERLCR